jgi:hypothetical protein
MIETLPLTTKPKLINDRPRSWAYPLPIYPYTNTPVKGVMEVLLGQWNDVTLWRAGAFVRFCKNNENKIHVPLVPLLIVVEISKTKLDFSLGFFDGNSYRALEMN